MKSSEATVLGSSPVVSLCQLYSKIGFIATGFIATDPQSITRGLAEVQNLHRGSHRDGGDQHIMNIIIKE